MRWPAALTSFGATLLPCRAVPPVQQSAIPLLFSFLCFSRAASSHVFDRAVFGPPHADHTSPTLSTDPRPLAELFLSHCAMLCATLRRTFQPDRIIRSDLQGLPGDQERRSDLSAQLSVHAVECCSQIVEIAEIYHFLFEFIYLFVFGCLFFFFFSSQTVDPDFFLEALVVSHKPASSLSKVRVVVIKVSTFHSSAKLLPNNCDSERSSCYILVGTLRTNQCHSASAFHSPVEQKRKSLLRVSIVYGRLQQGKRASRLRCVRRVPNNPLRSLVRSQLKRQSWDAPGTQLPILARDTLCFEFLTLQQPAEIPSISTDPALSPTPSNYTALDCTCALTSCVEINLRAKVLLLRPGIPACFFISSPPHIVTFPLSTPSRHSYPPHHARREAIDKPYTRG